MISVCKKLPCIKTLVLAGNMFIRKKSNLIPKYPPNILNKNLKANTMHKIVSLISAKMCLGQGKPGTELAPNYLKNEILLSNLENLNYEACEQYEIEHIEVPKEIEFLNNKNILGIAKTNEKLSQSVYKAIKEGHIPVVLGGDHSLAIGSVYGTATALSDKHQIGLIWIDAHADINTPMTSWSGNLHGQSVSFLLYELEKYHPKLDAFNWMKPCLTARNMVYIGLRDLDHDETVILNKYKIKAYSMSDIERIGIKQVMKETLEYLTINGELLPLHVSVDIDSLDPWYAPSTGTPVLGGLTLPQLMYIGNSINDTGKLTTLDLVEVNPKIRKNSDDTEDYENDEDVKKTIFSATRVILSFFGYKTIGTFNPNYQIPKP